MVFTACFLFLFTGSTAFETFLFDIPHSVASFTQKSISIILIEFIQLNRNGFTGLDVPHSLF